MMCYFNKNHSKEEAMKNDRHVNSIIKATSLSKNALFAFTYARFFAGVFYYYFSGERFVRR